MLTDDEIVEVWNACRDDGFGRIIKLLLLTAQREEEVGSMRWSELDLKEAVWSLPSPRTKNERSHIVPLSDPAIDIIGGIERRSNRDLVFGRGEGGFSGWSKAKAALDDHIHLTRVAIAKTRGKKPRRVEAMPHWVIHDLRRTAVTGMSELKTPPNVIEAVVNHVSGAKGGIAGVHNRAQHLPERREALDLWAEHAVGVSRGAKPASP